MKLVAYSPFIILFPSHSTLYNLYSYNSVIK